VISGRKSRRREEPKEISSCKKRISNHARIPTL
jgi:hypothetical protein